MGAGVYSRPIGANQGIQFPIAEAFAQTRAAALMVDAAARRYEAGEPAGAEANMVRHALVPLQVTKDKPPLTFRSLELRFRPSI